jgi:hypothetical protein
VAGGNCRHLEFLEESWAMIRFRSGIAGAAALAALVAGAPAHAEFFGWQVSGVSPDDVLMVRAAPTSDSPILVGYPEATPLSLTGTCTGGVLLDAINGLPPADQADAVAASWCEVWLDPLATGDFQAGWVYGKYIAPL